MVGSSIYTDVIDALNRHKGRILDFAAIGLSKEQFEAFRRLTLEELGKSGFEAELKALIEQHLERKR